MKKTLDQISELIEPLLTPMHEQHLNKEVWTNLNKIKAILNNPSQPERVEGGVVAKLQNEIEQLKLIRSGIHEGSPKWHDYSGRIEQQERIILQLTAAPSAVDWSPIAKDLIEIFTEELDGPDWEFNEKAAIKNVTTYLQTTLKNTLTAKD